MCFKEIAIIALLSVSVALVGGLISYPPYARLAGLTVFIAGLSLLALRKRDIKSISEESLERYAGEGSDKAGESLVKRETSGKKGNRQKTHRSKAKRK